MGLLCFSFRNLLQVESFGDRRLYLLVMENYTPVIFCTLTQPNATTLQLASGYAGMLHIEALEDFMLRAARRWGVHLRFDIGWEDTHNQHSHLIISVLNTDLDRFRKRKDRFDPARAWRWNRSSMDWQVFDSSKGDVWSYVTRKHTHLLKHACPGKLSSCRRGVCAHSHS